MSFYKMSQFKIYVGKKEQDLLLAIARRIAFQANAKKYRLLE